MNVANKPSDHYSPLAHDTFMELEWRVNNIFADVKHWRGWQLISDPATPREEILALVREIFRSVAWYQKHTTEAGFHMFGRLPKSEVKLIQALCGHKAEEAEHGIWAVEDFGKLGGKLSDAVEAHPSPATFVVAAVWWRMAQVEDPLGYLGAEYLFEQLTALVTQAALPVIEARELPRDGLRFVIEHATEDAKHATFIKHQVLDVATRYPDSAASMLRTFDYFHAVYPLPVWDEAFERARRGRV
ncbi:iron-containing redox enzyme family protein [Tardiphaga sp.]|uniref:iron-containing redox enzyme family protein n=1 Tax=Tardiphaga sp. TaxID=1926292 RepID=UPI00352B40FE